MGVNKWKNLSQCPTYYSWRSMKDRCLKAYHHAYKNYGGKGITICARWMDYDLFFEDMGERPFNTTLDRIDGKGNYEPSNCRWASWRVQQNNKDSLTRIEKNGVIKTIGEWAFELCLTKTEISKAYKRYSLYNAKTFNELFCEHLLTHRVNNRENLCRVCGLLHTIKWRKDGKLCNNCYHRALRWSKRVKQNIESYPEWINIKWDDATLIVKELEAKSL